MSNRLVEQLFPVKEIRAWSELSVQYLKFQQKQNPQSDRFSVALQRYTDELLVLNSAEDLKIELISFNTLYKMTGVQHLADMPDAQRDALDILFAQDSDPTDIYSTSLRAVVAQRAGFLRTGNPSYYLSMLADSERELKGQENLKLTLVAPNRATPQRGTPEKFEP